MIYQNELDTIPIEAGEADALDSLKIGVLVRLGRLPRQKSLLAAHYSALSVSDNYASKHVVAYPNVTGIVHGMQRSYLTARR